MAVSTSALVPYVRDQLYERVYETTSTTTTTATTVAVTDGTRWAEGDIGEWQTGTVGGEQFYVKSVSSNDLTVVRGYAGTTAETHTSGDRILKNPRYTYRQIFRALTQALGDLWPQVWTTGTVSITPAPSTTIWYNLHASTLGIVSVQQLLGTTPEQGVRYGTHTLHGTGFKQYIAERGMLSGLVASGNGMKFPNGFYATSTVTVTDMRAVTGTSDIEDSTTLPVAEAVTLGAVVRLLGGSEIQRISYAENTDVEPQIRLAASAYYRREAAAAIEKCARKLNELYVPDVIWR